MTRNMVLRAALACCLLPLAAQTTAAVAPLPRKEIHVSSGVLATQLVRQKLPTYPEEALQQHIQGEVVIHVLVDPTGHVAEAKLVSGDPALVGVSLEAATDCEFRPYRINGEAIYVYSEIVFDFSIRGHGKKIKGRVEYEKNGDDAR